MFTDQSLLLLLALSIGFFHTLMGPDHYLPFIVMAKAKRWSMPKTALITALCGSGHVLSSILLGFAGIALGLAVTGLSFIESVRGEIAAWFLIGFGFVYGIWGLRSAIKDRKHTHLLVHRHGDGELHTHSDGHGHRHHNHSNMTPWVLFVIFVLGPCEPLIPLLIYPAAKGTLADVVLVSLVFGVVTIATMTGIVMAASFGLKMVHFPRLERYGNAFAGLVICMSGLAIKFLGL